MIMVAMSYFCRQNVSQISLEIVANCSHSSEILALADEIARPRPDMNIKVAAFTVSKKSINTSLFDHLTITCGYFRALKLY